MEYRDLDMMEAAGKGYIPSEQPLSWALQYRSYPVVSLELVNFVRWYPICFEEKSDGIRMVMPAALEPGDSVLINPETGKWVGKSMPLFLRRYPFILNYEKQEDGSAKPILRMVEAPGLELSAQAPRKVVDANGAFTPVARNMMTRMARYDACLAADLNRIALFRELDLFVPWELDVGQEGDAATPFLKIDEGRLLALPDDAVVRLHKLKAWRMIYGHLYSVALTNAPTQYLNRIKKRQEATEQMPSIFDDDNGLIEF